MYPVNVNKMNERDAARHARHTAIIKAADARLEKAIAGEVQLIVISSELNGMKGGEVGDEPIDVRVDGHTVALFEGETILMLPDRLAWLERHPEAKAALIRVVRETRVEWYEPATPMFYQCSNPL